MISSTSSIESRLKGELISHVRWFCTNVNGRGKECPGIGDIDKTGTEGFISAHSAFIVQLPHDKSHPAWSLESRARDICMKWWDQSFLEESWGPETFKAHKAEKTFQVLVDKQRVPRQKESTSAVGQWRTTEESLNGKRKAPHDMLTPTFYILISLHPSKQAHLCSIILVCDFMMWLSQNWIFQYQSKAMPLK